jgi:hypothetical protein
MSGEIIQKITYDIIMIIFNMSASYFHKISFHYFDYYLMMKLTLGLGCLFVCFVCHIKIYQIMVSLVALLIRTGEECSMSWGASSWFHNVLTYGEEVIG